MRNWTCFFVTISLANLMGCSGEIPIPGIVDVTGTVALKGQPVEGVTVNFHPDSGSRAASGRTDAKGRFTLTTFNPGDGALPGTYRVSVSKIEDTDPSRQLTSEQFAGIMSGKAPPPPPSSKPRAAKDGGLKYHVPKKYMDTEKSGLIATVDQDGENDFQFDLE